MHWKQAAQDELGVYRHRREALTSIAARINALKQAYESVKTSDANAAPVLGGMSRVEEMRIENIAERERLRRAYYATKRLVELTEKGLNSLTEQERMILEKFYISPQKGNIDRLCSELGYEKTRIYELKDKALYHFTCAMFGLIDY